MNAKEMPMAVTRPIRAASCDAPTSPVSPRCGGGSLQIPSFILAAAPTASLSGLWGLLLRRGHGCGHLRGSLSVCAAAASAPNVALFPRQRLHLLPTEEPTVSIHPPPGDLLAVSREHVLLRTATCAPMVGAGGRGSGSTTHHKQPQLCKRSRAEQKSATNTHLSFTETDLRRAADAALKAGESSPTLARRALSSFLLTTRTLPACCPLSRAAVRLGLPRAGSGKSGDDSPWSSANDCSSSASSAASSGW